MRIRVTAAALSAIALLALTGCTTPAPADPTPTPPFASEEEAFAAAEETYRAYVDALNSRREDPASIPAPTDFLIGEALESEIDAARTLKEQGLAIAGTAVPVGFFGIGAAPTLREVSANVCLDVSRSRVLDAAGNDVTPSDRPEVLALEIHFVDVGGALSISRSVVADSQPC